MRRPLIAANWKMNPAPAGALDNDSPYRSAEHADVWVFPTYLDIRSCVAEGLHTGAQYGARHQDGYGAHTGDVSMQMLKDSGCAYVLCGHSERRQFHGENSQEVANQAVLALECGIHPIICVGETLEERENGIHKDMVHAQLSVLPLGSSVTIAYEPIWAIGTGNTATPEQAQEMHAFIRSLLPEQTKETTRILYGGSVKPDNAASIFAQADIDGALVGGASLKPDQCAAIVAAAKQ